MIGQGGCELVDHAARQLGEVDRLGVQLYGSGVEAGQVEQVH